MQHLLGESLQKPLRTFVRNLKLVIAIIVSLQPAISKQQWHDANKSFVQQQPCQNTPTNRMPGVELTSEMIRTSSWARSLYFLRLILWLVAQHL